MKRFNLRLFLAVLSVLALNVGVCTGQAKFGLETAQKVGRTIKIEQTEYEVWKTAKTGSEFIKLQSTHGNTYALWIGKETGETIDGMPVRVTSSGKLFIIVLSKNGNPYNKYLK
jgi:hypothetical protein